MKHETAQDIMRRRLNHATAIATQFAEQDMPESAEMWELVAGYLAATWEEMRKEGVA